jgi:outer membrane protein assembly factor BamB/tRNA A-37 threonylcarbamoyl transferase component Bud32
MALIKKGGGSDLRRTGLLRRDKKEEPSSQETPQHEEADHTNQPTRASHEKKDEETRSVAPTARKKDEETRSVAPAAPATPAQAEPGTRQGMRQSGTGNIEALADGSVLQGRYVIEGILGIGGMSVVYRGRDLRFKDVVRSCAVKEMYQRDPDSQTRVLKLRHFEREAGLLATLNHPAIPKVYDFFEEEGRVYLVQELVPGKDLETVMDEQDAPIEEGRLGAWAVQICDVLHYLHNHEPDPIVFRDMKPSNVLLTADERIVLIDFGIARLLDPSERKGTMIGTEGYAPPEQYRGMAEPQGDIYALGASMHHLLTANDPRMETPFTFQNRPITRLNPRASSEMEAVIYRTLEYNLEDRWSSAEELKQALLAVPSVSDYMQTGAFPVLPGAGTTPRAGGSTRTELVWSFKCEDEVRSSPHVSNNTLFVGCYDHNLYALDATNGTFRWKHATEKGISSSPSVWQDIVVIGSEDGSVYGVDIRNGSRRWIFRTEGAVRSSPTIQERVVFIGSDDSHFYALDGLRGVLIWKYRARAAFRSSAGLDRDHVYIGCDDSHVYCLEIRSSNVKWKQRTQKPIMSRPYHHQGMVFVGSMDNYVYALEAQGGVPVWKFRTGHNVYSSPTMVENLVIVGSSDGTLYAINRKSGREAWTYETSSQIASSPCCKDGRVYFGAIDGFIYCVDASSGKLIWKYQTDGPVVSSATVANDIVYIGSMDYQVYALKA